MTTHRRIAIAVAATAALVLPSTARADHGEEQIAGTTLEGLVEVRHSDDFQQGRAEWRYFLRTGSERVELLKPGGRLELRGGQRVTARGRLVGNSLVLAADDAVTAAPEAAAAPAVVGGVRRTAVILFNFSNDQREPFSVDQVRSQIFTARGSVNHYYIEQSYAQVIFIGKQRQDGDVYGWHTIASTSAVCDYTSWATQARAAATAAGADLTGYQHIIYLFPQVASCGWAGLAYVPGSESWINGALTTRVIAHELGHNLGVHHAGSLRCTAGGATVAISSTCSFSEYGDPFDVMGSGTRQFSNRHKGQLGWFPAQKIISSPASGTYPLLAHEAAPNGPQVIRIPRGSTGEFYYLELRYPYGAFDTFAPSDPVVNGISIRLANDWSSVTQSKLIDTTPETGTFLDSALSAGRTFVDAAYGIAVRTEYLVPWGALVTITLGEPPPPPSDTLPPSTPPSFQVTAVDRTSISVAWGVSTDNVGVAGYGVYRNGVRLASTTNSAVRYINLACGTTYTVGVDAYDAAGNRSPMATVTRATAAC